MSEQRERIAQKQREREAVVRPMIEGYCETMIRAAVSAVYWAELGYGPHLATRDTDLPKELADWVQRGCKSKGAA